MLPNSFEKTIKVKLHIAADDHSIGFFCDKVHFFHRNRINFVVAVETFDVLSVA